MTGIHIFEKRSHIDYEDEMVGVLLLSILSWKKFHGRIELYTNEEYLEVIKKWGIDELYDKIDIDTLKSIPKNVDRNRYWAFGKIFISSRIETPFVIIDTDLWIREALHFDKSKSFISYHKEDYDQDSADNTYPDFDNIVGSKFINRWNKLILPTNTALLFLNDRKLVDEWYNCALEITSNNFDIYDPKNSISMCFIEQRLLPMISFEMGLPYSTFIKPVYQSHMSRFGDGSEWEPHVSTWDYTIRKEFSNIKHVWGMKKMFDDVYVRSVVMASTLHDLSRYDTTKFTELLRVLRSSVIPIHEPILIS